MKILLCHVMCKKQLSMNQVSMMTGVSKTAVYNIMHENSYPRMDTMELLAKGLKVGIDDLYDSKYKEYPFQS